MDGEDGARAGRGPTALVALACLLAASCAREEAASAESGPAVGPALSDVAHVAAADETSFEGLPEDESLAALSGRFERLSEDGRAEVMARANRSACSCGCPGHTVAHCLHQKETCDVAVALVERFVADQHAVELNAPPGPADEASASAASAEEGAPVDGTPPAAPVPPAGAGPQEPEVETQEEPGGAQAAAPPTQAEAPPPDQDPP